MGEHLRRGFGWWVFFWLLWWALSAPADPWNLAFGGLVAGLAAALLEAARGADPSRFRLRSIPPRLILRLPRALLRDAWSLTRRLQASLLAGEEREGAFRTVPFEENGTDASSASDRALITFAISLLPNTFVLGIDRDEGRILVHELLPGEEDALVPR